MTLFDKLLAWAPSRTARKRVIHVNDHGFSVSANDSDAPTVAWSSVNEIVAFKHDLFGFDEICLGFRCDGDDRHWWAGEDDVGFKDLQAAVAQRFEGMLEDWWSAVVFPAFTENWTSIWSRAGRS